MARMHTRRRGQHGSKHPLRSSAPEWTGLTTDEIERNILKLRDQGMSSSEIGIVLRDKHGVPDVKLSTGKKITQKIHNKFLNV